MTARRIDRLRYFKKNWKIGIHLLFRTKRFGVNNQRWSTFDSLFGRPTKKIIIGILTIKPIIENYRQMKNRAGTGIHFLSDRDYELAFGKPKT